MLSIGSTVGRFGLSAIGDYAGPLNMWFLCQLLATSLFILWPTVNAYATLILFAIAYGLATGGFVSLYPMCITNVLGADNLAEKIGRWAMIDEGRLVCSGRRPLTRPPPFITRYSVYNGFIFGTIAGGPIAGALIDRSTVFGPNGERLSTNYWPVAGYGFAVSLLSYLCVIYIRWEMGRKAAPGGRRVAGIGII